MIKKIFPFLFVAFTNQLLAQSNIVTYAGGSGKETFYDVMQITDGTFLVTGYAEDLSWTGAAPKTQLTYTASIPNSLGTNRYGFILHLSSDLQTIMQVIHFPQGAVEDIRFIKTNSQPYTPTGDLYISCNTADIDNNDGGYILAKLNFNFINGIPSSLDWVQVVWAKAGPKDYHPWDVTSDGRVYYISGEAHGYDWSAMYCLNQNGQRMVVENWRTHWLTNGTEWKGSPASANPLGSINSVDYSGIVLKITGRCELRSWTTADFNSTLSDGNGGTKKGKWPADFLFNSPCDPNNPTATGPGYNGYSYASGSPVWGGSCICIDKRDNHVYLGMNFKSYYNPQNTPDFEPAVIAFDDSGNMLWWSRLYHEITPAGDTVGSIPDQYVDALSIDYTNNKLVVGARAHGNNTENFWEGNTILANTTAYGFQNQFTGTNGNIHESWLGKLQLSNGALTNSTYMAELAEGTGGLGTPHSETNLDGWPDPNTGWPDVNTTKLVKNNMKVTSSGDVVVMAVGRRTITTANAYHKMVKPFYGGQSAWNSFVRVYDEQLQFPKYSSLVVGIWDTLTQAGGDNTELFGVYKTASGVICVGRQKADASGIAIGNDIPVINVTQWGNSTPQNESAILVYYNATNLYNQNDSILTTSMNDITIKNNQNIIVFPNPNSGTFNFSLNELTTSNTELKYSVVDIFGRVVSSGIYHPNNCITTELPNGFYIFQLNTGKHTIQATFIITK